MPGRRGGVPSGVMRLPDAEPMQGSQGPIQGSNRRTSGMSKFGVKRRSAEHAGRQMDDSRRSCGKGGRANGRTAKQTSSSGQSSEGRPEPSLGWAVGLPQVLRRCDGWSTCTTVSAITRRYFLPMVGSRCSGRCAQRGEDGTGDPSLGRQSRRRARRAPLTRSSSELPAGSAATAPRAASRASPAP